MTLSIIVLSLALIFGLIVSIGQMLVGPDTNLAIDYIVVGMTAILIHSLSKEIK